MTDRSSEMEEVTVEFDEEILDEIDEKAFRDHRENRDAAIRDLLDRWLKDSEER